MILCRTPIAGARCTRRFHDGSSISALHGTNRLFVKSQRFRACMDKTPFISLSKTKKKAGVGMCSSLFLHCEYIPGCTIVKFRASLSSCEEESQVGGRLRWSLVGKEKPLVQCRAAGNHARYYSNNSEDRHRGEAPRASSVAQKGKYTRGLGVKAEEEREAVSRRFGVPKRELGEEDARVVHTEKLQRFYATCAPGLEEVLVAELSSPLIGALKAEAGSAGVSFVGTLTTGYRANLWLRTAVRVLIELAAAPLPLGNGRFDPVYEFVRDAADWPSILVDDSRPVPSVSSEIQNPRDSSDQYRQNINDRFEEKFARDKGRPKTQPRTATTCKFRNFAVQSRVWNCTDISNSNFASIRAKDAICDAVRDACGGNRPEPPEEGGSMADVPLFLSLYRDNAVLYRDLSGVSLHKRGYRDVMHRASLNEGIAAAVLTIAGWNQALPGFGDANKNAVGKEKVLLDPMCGSGTFLIEAALMARNVAPGLMRKQWPFQTWHDFDQQAWTQCRDAAAAEQVSSVCGVRLLGNDIHEGALSLCKKDAKTAGVLHLLDLSCSDCRDYLPPAVPSIVVTNPPWGSRLTDSSDDEESEWLSATWQALGRFLKDQCSCADVYVLSGNAEVTRAMHMKADRKWPVTVGGQERKLLHYHVLPPKSQTQKLMM